MAVPVISNLPPAPTRNDGAADFTPKADAMIGALRPMVVQINIALQWMNGRLTDTQAAQAAAAASASAAAASATLAGQKVGLAADQVELAVAAKNAATESANRAAAAAAAAGEGAGFPQDGSVGDVLVLGEGGQVGWGSIFAVAAPSNIAPAAGAIEIYVADLAGSAFYSLYGKPQASRQARMSLSPVFSSILWDSGEIAGASTNIAGPSLDGLIPTRTVVYWQIRYKDVAGAWSPWSAATSFTAAAQYAPTAAGVAFGGGFYAGRMKIGQHSYALISAPKASGEAPSLQFKTSNTLTLGATSTWDGAANTAAMIAAGAAAHPAASFCKNLTIGGHADWALPAKDQLELLYRVFKPGTTLNAPGHGLNPSSDPVGDSYTEYAPVQTAIAAFKTGGSEAFEVDRYYWTSSDATAAGAWAGSFINGTQSTNPPPGNAKPTPLRVRAIRMIRV